MPERNLLVAVLRRALFDYFGNVSSDRDQAAEWLFEEIGNDDVFSFEWVCEHLGNDPATVRGRIKNLAPRDGGSAQEWYKNAALN